MNDLCEFCGHLLSNHGTTETGCSECDCGHEPDWVEPKN